jgi:hypothetical protein
LNPIEWLLQMTQYGTTPTDGGHAPLCPAT